MNIVYYNSRFLKDKEINFDLKNRAFNFGDGFFESIKVINSKPFNLDLHFKRINYALNILHLKMNESFEVLESIIYQLIEKNNITSGNMKIHISRTGGGKYYTSELKSNLVILVRDSFCFAHNTPITLTPFYQQLKPKNSLSNIKTLNSLTSILAMIYAKNMNVDNAILYNTDNNIVQAANGNIFFVISHKTYTPPISEGCVCGTMRQFLLNNENITEKVIIENDIKNADEIFISNAIKGVVPIKKITGSIQKKLEIRKANIIQQKLINLSSGSLVN